MMNQDTCKDLEQDYEFSPQPLFSKNTVYRDLATLDHMTSNVALTHHRQTGGRPIKVCIYSHDTFGLGHLRRNLAIADRLLSHQGTFSVWLITGSPVIRKWSLPKGLKVQPLPPVVKTGDERYASRKAGETFGMVKGYREALILKLVIRQRPDIFLVDHAPAGMHGELLSTLALIHRELPNSRAVLGLRDILDNPEVVRKLWYEQDIYGLLEQAYDDILVYGSRRIFNVGEAYGLSSNLAEKVKYCGYVVNAETSPTAAPVPSQDVCWNKARAGRLPVILVTAGGGGDGYLMMNAYLKALQHLPRNQCYSVIVTGPLMPKEQREKLQAMVATRTDIEFVDYTTNLVPSVQHAELVVAMAGYNTSAEIIATRKKAIFIPRTAPREEQLLRARMLASLGVAWCAEPGPALEEELAALLPIAMAAPCVPQEAWDALDLNGADAAASYLLELFESNTERMEGAI